MEKSDLIVFQFKRSTNLLITNHPFLDGNKRFGYVDMRLLLLDSDIDITATEDEKFEFVISIAIGELKFPDICSWINRHQLK